ncbi:MAG: low specificity L-threonine aldolase [Oscillospiraceae bacterium]|nr:low specificity L-threonine aldolase [Oscillospiraceae bacterium]
MLHFDSDYMEGAHPLILECLERSNYDKNPGYGSDDYCRRAADRIRQLCGCPGAAVYFLPGGTQANATVIDFLLKNYQGVLSAYTGHINVHEAGAVEAYGHKILTLSHTDGKLSPSDIDAYMDAFVSDPTHEHMVEPGMVYISHPTEYGASYSLGELEELHRVCRGHSLSLYMDGARLGYALAARGSDLSLEQIASLCDAFYIGGTKVGALFGEAVVFPDAERSRGFFTLMKRHGAVTAKGWLLGLQFEALLEGDTYTDIARHADLLADSLRDGLKAKGYRIFTESSTNQVMVVVPNAKLSEISKDATYSYWERFDSSSSVVRFAVSWATKESDVHKLLSLM